MKSLEQLTNLLHREEELAETHRKKAADIKKQIELYRCDMANKKLNSLHLSPEEYDKLMSFLSTGKKNVLSAAEKILENEREEEALE